MAQPKGPLSCLGPGDGGHVHVLILTQSRQSIAEHHQFKVWISAPSETKRASFKAHARTCLFSTKVLTTSRQWHHRCGSPQHLGIISRAKESILLLQAIQYHGLKTKPCALQFSREQCPVSHQLCCQIGTNTRESNT